MAQSSILNSTEYNPNGSGFILPRSPFCCPPLLEVENLTVKINGSIILVDGVSLKIEKGEVVALIGESGSGKTTIAQAIGQIYLPSSRPHLSGSIRFKGQELIGMKSSHLRKYRGAGIAYIFQDPLAALNPVQPVGVQIAESYMIAKNKSFDEAHEAVIKIMKDVYLPKPEALFWKYPFELSGGMRQRIAISCVAIQEPELIIADEPTSALDAALQMEILEILLKRVREEKTALLMITHDFSLVEEVAKFAYVLDSGRIVESASMDEILRVQNNPKAKALVLAYKRLQGVL